LVVNEKSTVGNILELLGDGVLEVELRVPVVGKVLRHDFAVAAAGSAKLGISCAGGKLVATADSVNVLRGNRSGADDRINSLLNEGVGTSDTEPSVRFLGGEESDKERGKRSLEHLIKSIQES